MAAAADQLLHGLVFPFFHPFDDAGEGVGQGLRPLLQQYRALVDHLGAGEQQLERILGAVDAAGSAKGKPDTVAQLADPVQAQQGLVGQRIVQLGLDLQGFQIQVRLVEAVEQGYAVRSGRLEPTHEVTQ